MKNRNYQHKLWGILAICFFFQLIGCSQKTAYIDPDVEDKLGGTGVDSQDIRSICQQMSRAIINTPEIVNAEKRPTIALTDIENNTRFRIDVTILTEMIRDELINNAGGKVRFLAREDLTDIQSEKQAKQAGVFESGQSKKLKGADYFLTGTLRSITKSSDKGKNDYIVYMFRLVDTESSEMVWSGRYETKKQGEFGVVYR